MAKKSIVAEFNDVSRNIAKFFVTFCLPGVLVLVLLHFPRDKDPSNGALTRPSVGFYEAVYSGPDKNGVSKRSGINYEQLALQAAKQERVPEKVSRFVDAFNLHDKKVLEVGSGQGSLQDLVEDYTGLDISPTAASKYHKNFVVGSATAMPFPDNSFDAVWTIWVIEHIPEPEQAMREIRRVLKPGGKLYLHVAWNCDPWLADGFNVRPYSDFNWRGKLVKASTLLRGLPVFMHAYRYPTRLIRWSQYSTNGANERLQFHALNPNYETYWEPDSDAAISLDSVEALLWHHAQGDRCLNCTSTLDAMADPPDAWIIEIRK